MLRLKFMLRLQMKNIKNMKEGLTNEKKLTQ